MVHNIYETIHPYDRVFFSPQISAPYVKREQNQQL